MIATTVAFALDILIVAVALVVAAIAVTGGGTFHLGPAIVRATSVANPVLIGITLSATRLLLRRRRPFFLAVRILDLRSIEQASRLVVDRFAGQCSSSRGCRRILWGLVGASVALRVANVIVHPGFITGDDVEIHEMTLGHLLGMQWPVWNLRSPAYPMAFIYPVQALAHAVGISSVAQLVIAGRLAVVAIATVSIWAVYRITTTLSGSSSVGCLAAALFALSRLHLWFGSSELPRPVATVFILIAFSLLLRPSTSRAVGAAVLLAAGGSLRFGELVFFAPATAQLFVQHRWRDLVFVSAAGVVTVIVILGAADWLYWGQPFHSWRAMYQYAIVERKSSSGFQPFQPAWFYVGSAAGWTNYVVLGLSLYAFRMADKRVALWAWIPIVLFSTLPHKEVRYMIAAQPFACIAAALSARDLYGRFTARAARPSAAAVLAAAIAVAMVVELGDWQFRRTDTAVRFARQLQAQHPSSVAAQQLWRLGGRLYFAGVPRVEELPDDLPTALDAVQRTGIQWVLMRRDLLSADAIKQLTDSGYSVIEASGLEYVVLRKG